MTGKCNTGSRLTSTCKHDQWNVGVFWGSAVNFISKKDYMYAATDKVSTCTCTAQESHTNRRSRLKYIILFMAVCLCKLLDTTVNTHSYMYHLQLVPGCVPLLMPEKLAYTGTS